MENEYIVKIIEIEKVTHNVKRFRIEKPEGFKFTPGQATEISINKNNLKNLKNPFTFTSLNDWPFIEFTIKIYPEHKGVTYELDKLISGDEVIIRDVFGTINYQGNGIFIAGGAGITPFIAILRQLTKEGKIEGNLLIFSNKTENDILLKEELMSILGKNCIFILTDENKKGYDHGRINEYYLKTKISDFKQNFYVCGPPGMADDLKAILIRLGANVESIVFEK